MIIWIIVKIEGLLRSARNDESVHACKANQ